MDIRDALKNTLYFAIGATAVGIEKLSDAAKSLTEKGSVIVSQRKADFMEFCESVAPESKQPAPSSVKHSSKDTAV